MSKFKKDEIVLYKNGDSYELGKIKEVIKPEHNHYWIGNEKYAIGSWEYNFEEQTLKLYTPANMIITELTLESDYDLSDDEILETLEEVFEEYYYNNEHEYRVYYHTGDTSALTNESNLHKIKNSYAFMILKRNVDISSYDETDARRLAMYIISGLQENNLLEDISGKEHFEIEDYLTLLINTYVNE